ncbi:MAG: hypothetical protein HQL31_03395, partial [Planctomycetes bacterium]|nr:hypothetical protein [Planctomycetota bacterium]
MKIYGIIMGALLLLGSVHGETPTPKNSFTNDLQLDLSSFKAPQGVDIWLTLDEGRSWEMVGRTYRQGDSFTYRAVERGLHGFLYRIRSKDTDMEKPAAGSGPDELIRVDRLEEENPDILYSKSKSLDITYEIYDEGRKDSDTFQSDLYFTLNSGLTWNYYGPDQDRRSPVSFLADREALFGFKVVSVDTAGQKEAVPEPGKRPDVLVRIDVTQPKVFIVSPQPYDLWEAGTQRIVRWIASDEAIAAQNCVSL